VGGCEKDGETEGLDIEEEVRYYGSRDEGGEG
jgi:hypothetical protein